MKKKTASSDKPRGFLIEAGVSRQRGIAQPVEHAGELLQHDGGCAEGDDDSFVACPGCRLDIRQHSVEGEEAVCTQLQELWRFVVRYDDAPHRG